MYIFHGIKRDRLAGDFDFRFFLASEMFALDPNAGFGGQVLAAEFFGDQGVDKHGVKLGSFNLDVQVVANALYIDFHRGGLDDDLLHLWKTALGFTGDGIAPSAETGQPQGHGCRVKQPSFSLQRHVRCPFSVLHTKPLDKWVSSVLLCGTPPREV